MSIKAIQSDLRSKLQSQYSISTVDQCICELIFNSLDALSSKIIVYIDLNQYFTIRVQDNGIGISAEDLAHVGTRDWTTKLPVIVHTRANYGSKGQSLANIISMCSVCEVSSKTGEFSHGYKKVFHETKSDGVQVSAMSMEKGTDVAIYDFLYNMPVRKRNLNSSLQTLKIKNSIEIISLCHYDVSFMLINSLSYQILLDLPRVRTQIMRIGQIFGDICDELVELTHEHNVVSITGYASKVLFPNKIVQCLFINKRPVLKHDIIKFLDRSIKSAVRIGCISGKPKYSLFIVNISLPSYMFQISYDLDDTIVYFEELDELKQLIKMVVLGALENKNKHGFNETCKYKERLINYEFMNDQTKYGNIVSGSFLDKTDGLLASRISSADSPNKCNVNERVCMNLDQSPVKVSDNVPAKALSSSFSGSLDVFKKSIKSSIEAGSSRKCSGLKLDDTYQSLGSQSALQNLSISRKLEQFSILSGRYSNIGKFEDRGDSVETAAIQKKFKPNPRFLNHVEKTWKKIFPIKLNKNAPPLKKLNTVTKCEFSGAGTIAKAVKPICINLESLEGIEILGQFNQQFIVCIYEKTFLCLIDQHAAHERVRLEQLEKDSMEDGWVKSSYVDPPMVMHFDKVTLAVLLESRTKFNELGFEFSWDGSDLTVTKVPACILSRQHSEVTKGRKSNLEVKAKEIILEELSNITNSNFPSSRITKIPKSISDMLKSQACHGAVKFGEPMTFEECQSLVQQLRQCHFPFQCAHGRPSVIPILDISQANITCLGSKPNLKSISRKMNSIKLRNTEIAIVKNL